MPSADVVWDRARSAEAAFLRQYPWFNHAFRCSAIGVVGFFSGGAFISAMGFTGAIVVLMPMLGAITLFPYLFLIFWAKQRMLAIYDTTPGASHCIECGYSLHGLDSDQCPECGEPVTRQSAAKSEPTVAADDP